MVQNIAMHDASGSVVARVRPPAAAVGRARTVTPMAMALNKGAKLDFKTKHMRSPEVKQMRIKQIREGQQQREQVKQKIEAGGNVPVVAEPFDINKCLALYGSVLRWMRGGK